LLVMLLWSLLFCSLFCFVSLVLFAWCRVSVLPRQFVSLLSSC
jgi:hypothetical protein